MIELTKYIEAHAGTAFKWREADCCQFTGGAIEVMTGSNPMNYFNDQYCGEVSGRALLEHRGGLGRILVDLFGPRVQRGVRGDIAFATFPDGAAVGIHDGTRAVFLSRDGLVTVPLTECRFFKVVRDV